MQESATTGGPDESLASAPGAVLAEFERLRHKLGFCQQPAALIDDRYRLERVVGRGAMGEVHLAYDHRLERTVALKLVRANPGISPATLQARIEREALALARVDHVNVIGIYDVGTHAGQTYFTMPFVAGMTLREWQAERSKPAILGAYLQAARGLAAAHACGVVHRDFKPDNVIVGDDGSVRVLDFGIAAALTAEVVDTGTHLEATLELESADERTLSYVGPIPSAGSELAAMTRPGTLLGTLPYMASEQLVGRRADARTDQFGLCVALWEAWSGQRPFPGRSPRELSESIALGPVRSEARSEALPRWLRTILVRGLAERPDRRWSSIDDLIAAIERSQSRRRGVVLGLGLTVALTAAAGLGRAMLPATTVAAGESCAEFIATIDEPWDTSARAALLTNADGDASRYAIATLDALADDWRVAGRELCEGEAAPPREAAARECLSAWRGSFAEHIELLVERDDAMSLAPDLLARLRPPSGDYCALRPSRPVDPELWRAAEHARAVVVLGDIEEAFESADAAVARARAVAGDRSLTVDAAVAHAARGEVAAFAGQHELALTELGLAERHALGSDAADLLFRTWVLGTKVLAPTQAELALAQIDRAEPLAFALELGELDPRRAELLEARGWAERWRGQPREAIALHRRAEALFVGAGQPTLAGKSLINIGANLQILGELEQARAVYAEAVRTFEAAGLPPSYRNRVQVERNLCLLAYASSEPAELAVGLGHCELVLSHGTDPERFEAFGLLIALALELDERPLVASWCERALAELDEKPHASAEDRAKIRISAGIALASIGDPRGEPLLELVERDREVLSLLVQFDLESSWITWLADSGRCLEAEQRRAAFVARMAAQAPDSLPSNYPAWRDAEPDPCPSEPNP